MITFKQFLITEATETAEKQEKKVTRQEIMNDAKRVLKTGVNRLLRLDHPQRGEDEERHAGRTVDAFDMLEAMEVMRKMFEDTKDLVGKKMRQGDTGFNYRADIKEAIREYYLSGSSEKEGALNRRKYRALVMLLLEPMVDLFKGVPHEEALKLYDGVIDDTIRFIKNSDVVTSADDAFVQRRMIQKEVQKANQVRKAVDGIMALRNKSKKKRKKRD